MVCVSLRGYISLSFCYDVNMVSKIANKARGLSLLVIVLITGGLLTFCSLASFALHTTETTKQSSTCSSVCGSHGQPISLSAHQNQEDEDDKEPMPPAAYWRQTSINLSLLYVAPLASIFSANYLFKKHLLSTQLRF